MGTEEQERHPDVFTAEEAAAFLKFPSLRCFNFERRRQGVKGHRAGNSVLYPRETLDAMRKRMFGIMEDRRVKA